MTDTPSTTRPLRFCFYCLRAYPIFQPKSTTIFGGAEVRSTTFAKTLARRPDFEVSFMTADEGQATEEIYEGVRILPDRAEEKVSTRFFRKAYEGYIQSCVTQPKFPFFHVKKWSWGLLWQIPSLAFQRWFYLPYTRRKQFIPKVRDVYRKHGFDAYGCFHANETAADIVATCRASGVKSVLFLISDDETKPPVPSREIPKNQPWRKAQPFVVRNADLIIAQTEYQAEQIKKHYDRTCVLIRNPIDLTGVEAPRSSAAGEFAFWIGRAEPPGYGLKRPELLLELARLCPDVPFLAIVNRDFPAVYDQMAATKPANLTLIDKVPFAEVERLYQRARLFISLSGLEGFPNAFLQAAKFSIPILSLSVDPAGMLKEHRSGIVFDGDLPAMARELTRLWSQPVAIEELGANARRFVETFHDINASTDLLAQALRHVVFDGAR